jgi:hypothetical protein
MSSSRLAATLAAVWILLAAVSQASDQEGCLFCHRLEIARAGSQTSDLRVTESRGAVHAGLYCSDCHPDARSAPHAADPGAARCIDECHSTGAGAVPEGHRRAAFGGLTEIHRRAAAPASPCSMCHKADDPPSANAPAAPRCASCHPGEAASVARGVHSRMARSGRGGCVACHPPHPAASASARPEKGSSCRKTGCHAAVTDGMAKLGAHGKDDPSERPGRTAGIVLYCAAAVLGLVPGLLLCRNAPRRKEGAR